MSDLTRFDVWAASVFAQVTMVVALAALLVWPVRRQTAARHAVWLSALVCVLLGPLVALVAPRVNVPVFTGERLVPVSNLQAPDVPSPTRPSVPPMDSPVAATPISVVSEPPTRPESAARVTFAAIERIPEPARIDVWLWSKRAVEAVWLLGTLVALGRLQYGVRTVARFRRSSRPPLPGVLDAIAADVRAGLGGELPAVAVSPNVVVPVAIGVVRPLVLLPNGLTDSLRLEQLRDVLIHEGAHLRRRDPLIGLLQRLAAAVFWPHPLVRWLNRCLALAREDVCDNYVLRRGSATAYARTLLELAERIGTGRAAPALGLIDAHGRLEARIAGLLAPGRNVMTRTSRWMWVGVGTVLLTCVLTIGGARFGVAASAQAPSPHAQTPTDPTKAVITGTVLDEAGRPVAGAAVRILSDWYSDGQATTTNAGGRFQFVSTRPALVGERVLAETDGGSRLGLAEASAHTSGDRSVDVQIILKPSRLLTVRVADGRGSPVAGAEVVALDYICLAKADTDREGVAKLQLAADANIEHVAAAKPGVGLDYFENFRSRPPPRKREAPPDEIRLVLNGALTVQVRAVDTLGRPVVGVECGPSNAWKPGKLSYINLSARTFGKAFRPVTDPQGYSVCNWLPVDLEGLVSFVAYSEEYGQRYGVGQAQFDCSRPESPITKQLQLNDARMSGRVTQPDGQPALGVLVEASGEIDSWFPMRRTARTNARGEYEMLLMPGMDYTVGVKDRSWCAPTRFGVRVELPPTVVDFQVTEGTVIHGRVTTGQPARPTSNHPIGIGQQRDNGLSWFEWLTQSDHDGRYSIRVAPGNYKTLVFDGAAPRIITLNVAQSPITRDYHLPRVSPSSLAGVVRKAGGIPVADATVIGAHPAEPMRFHAQADKQGRFAVDVYQVPPHLYAYDSTENLAGVVRLGEDMSSVNVSLSEAGHVDGRYVGPDGQPRPRVQFQFMLHIDVDGTGIVQFNRQIMTDADGRFAVGGLPVGARCTLNYYDRATQTNTPVARFTMFLAEAKHLGDVQVPAGK